MKPALWYRIKKHDRGGEFLKSICLGDEENKAGQVNTYSKLYNGILSALAAIVLKNCFHYANKLILFSRYQNS